MGISSGIINETNQYTFRYLFAPSTGTSASLVVKTNSLTKEYSAYVGLIVAQARDDFNIEIRVFDKMNAIVVKDGNVELQETKIEKSDCCWIE